MSFGDSDVERVDLSYHESLQRIVKGDVDAVIWNVVAENELTMLGLEATPLTDDPRFLQATEAVILTRVDDYPMQQLLHAVVDKLYPACSSTASSQWGTGTQLLNERHLIWKPDSTCFAMQALLIRTFAKA